MILFSANEAPGWGNSLGGGVSHKHNLETQMLTDAVTNISTELWHYKLC